LRALWRERLLGQPALCRPHGEAQSRSRPGRGHLRRDRGGQAPSLSCQPPEPLGPEPRHDASHDARRGGRGPDPRDRSRRARPLRVRQGSRGGVMASTKRPAPDLDYLCRAMKAPSPLKSVERLSERARSETWAYEEFLAACLEREVAARQSNGGEIRIRAARFPARKTLEDFDFDHQRSLKREVIAHLGALDFVESKENVVFLGPPGTGKSHLAIGLSM